MPASFPRFAVGAVLLLITLLVPLRVRAQICGDADGSGTVTVSDGVAVLRATAELSSVCAGRTCDLDGNGAFSVGDGVGVLRRAAELPTPLSCGTRFGELVKTVGSGGRVADLVLGQPPEPAPGAPMDVSAIEVASQVPTGETAQVIVRVLRSVDALLIAFREAGSFVDGFARLPLGDAGAAGSDGIEITLDIGDVPATTELSVSTTVDGQVGGFRSEPLTVVASGAPVISNLVVSVAVLNDASFCGGPPFSASNPGTHFVATFAYSDADGDVTDALTVTAGFLFIPSNGAGTVVLPFRDVTGDPFSGTIAARFCSRFVNDTAMENSFTLTDAAGNESNTLTTTTPRPDGAN